MTVRELIAHLHTFNPDLTVIHTICSDYGEITPDMVTEIEALPEGAGRTWFMRSHPRMTDEMKKHLRSYVHFEGN